MSSSAVLLFEDETIIRLFPGLKRGWSLKGEQTKILISGRNARRVLFGVINVRTGHRIIARYRNMDQISFQHFLRLVRNSYKGRPIWMLLDNAGCHKTAASLALAATLKIELLWLPKQCPELNAMDHLWRALKSDVSANDQYPGIEHQAQATEQYMLSLPKIQALRKAGILSDNFWLKAFSK